MSSNVRSTGKMTRESSFELKGGGSSHHDKSVGSLPEDELAAGAGHKPTPPSFEDGADALNLPPGRLHSTRNVKEKLSSSLGNLHVTPASLLLQNSSSGSHLLSGTGAGGTRSPGGSRSRSPSLKMERASLTNNTAAMGDSSISSLEDLVDSDILYDRKGLIDDLSQSSSTKGGASWRDNIVVTGSSLPSVNERLSEETLDDVHAFADVVVRSSNASRTPSIGTDRELMLDPLDEIDEENGDDESLEDPSEMGDQPHQQVILTNLEKISINDASSPEEASASAAAVLVRGSSSLGGGGGGADDSAAAPANSQA